MPSILQVALDTPLYRLFDYRLPNGAGPVQPGSLVEVPFGRTRQVGVALGPKADSAHADKLRDVIRVLDDRPALSPEILRLAQFCADYYHYPLGAVLLATLPPRLKNATPFAADTPWLAVTAAGRAAELPARARAQRALLDAMRSAPLSREALRAQKQGRHAAALVAAGRDRAAANRRCPARHRRAAGRARRAPARARRVRRASGPRRHRQRQDRAVSAPDRRRTGGGPPGAGADPRNRADAAARAAFPQPLPRAPHRHPAQRPGRDRTRRELARRPRSRRAARHPPVGIRAAAAARADRGRRGARRLVQAAGRPALFRARRRDRARQAGQAAGGARLGHALAGKLRPRAGRALPPDRAEAARGQPGAAAGDRAGRPAPPAAGQRAHPSRAGGADRNAGARRTGPGLPQPARLRAGAVLPELRLGVAVPELLGPAGAAPQLASPEMPPLRVRGAHPPRMPELRQP